MTLQDWNALPAEDAARTLAACCNVSGWVDAVVAGRPYASLDALHSAAGSVWQSLGPSAWCQAFHGHRRIGDRVGGWEAEEQSAAQRGSSDMVAALAEVNRDYERKFGHIFLTCATGKAPEQIVREARSRMSNDPERELEVAAEEQRRITALRLNKLFGANEDGRT